jgi:hypothetical protein
MTPTATMYTWHLQFTKKYFLVGDDVAHVRPTLRSPQNPLLYDFVL